MFWADLFKWVGNAIWSALAWVWEGIKSAIVSIGEFFTGLWNGVTEGIAKAWTWITGTIMSLVALLGLITES
jgi:phage-related protein